MYTPSDNGLPKAQIYGDQDAYLEISRGAIEQTVQSIGKAVKQNENTQQFFYVLLKQIGEVRGEFARRSFVEWLNQPRDEEGEIGQEEITKRRKNAENFGVLRNKPDQSDVIDQTPFHIDAYPAYKDQIVDLVGKYLKAAKETRKTSEKQKKFQGRLSKIQVDWFDQNAFCQIRNSSLRKESSFSREVAQLKND